MQTEEKFIRSFWNNLFIELNEHNRTMPDVAENPEDFINRLDQIAVEKEVSSFGIDENFEVKNGSVKAVMTISESSRNFHIYINADIRFEKNTKVKVVYVELSELHQNNKEFLTNIFFQKLPYTELEMLIDTLKDCNNKFTSALMEFRKIQKMIQLTVATIKSLLSEKFKNTRYEWEISDFGSGRDISFLITLKENAEEISKLTVDKTNLVQKIIEWQI